VKIGDKVIGKYKYTGWVKEVGKLVCIVKDGRRNVYIVQFKRDWCWFFRHQIKKVKEG